MVSASDSQSGGPGSSPATGTYWICSRLSRVESLATLVNSQLAASCQLGFLILLCLLKRRGNQTKTNEKIEPLHMFQLFTLQEIDCKIRITLNIKVN